MPSKLVIVMANTDPRNGDTPASALTPSFG